MNLKKNITMKHLKLIAYITMLIDHIGAVLIEPKIFNYDMFKFLGIFPAAKIIWSDPFNVAYVLCRYIGRIAFPIFCFNLVEGYYHTRDVKKYMLRLLILAILSEIPFDLSFAKSPFAMNYQNVIWCLLIGLLCIYLSDKVFNKNIIATILVFILGAY